MAREPIPAPFSAVSNTPLSSASSAPTRSLLRKRRLASSRPDSSVSSSVFKNSGSISKLSDRVARPSLATAVLYAPAAPAVVPVSPVQVPRAFCPVFDVPKSIADLVNLPRPAVDIGLPILASLAACPARPSHPAIGINPTPKATRSSVTSPAVPISGLIASNASVTVREVLVSKA